MKEDGSGLSASAGREEERGEQSRTRGEISANPIWGVVGDVLGPTAGRAPEARRESGLGWVGEAHRGRRGAGKTSQQPGGEGGCGGDAENHRREVEGRREKRRANSEGSLCACIGDGEGGALRNLQEEVLGATPRGRWELRGQQYLSTVHTPWGGGSGG